MRIRQHRLSWTAEAVQAMAELPEHGRRVTRTTQDVIVPRATEAVRAVAGSRAARAVVTARPVLVVRRMPAPGLISLAIVLAAASALLVGPSPVGRFIGHRLTGTTAGARPAHGAAVAPDAPAAGQPGSAGADAAPQPGDRKPGATPGTRPSGPAASTSRPPDPTAGALRRTGTDAVALTFDDGPDPVQTPAMLDLLKEQGVKATFCVVGFRARRYPELIKRIAAEGHTLCSHSWQHLLDLAKRPTDYLKWDLESTNEAIRAAVPDADIPYFRAPGGNFTPELVAFAKWMGMESIYWHVDPRDWDHKKDSTPEAHVARVVAAVQKYTRPGSIVLSHDNGQPDTIVAYRTLLPWLKERFRLEPLPVRPPA